MKKRWFILMGLAAILLVGNIIFYVMGEFYPNQLNKGDRSLKPPTALNEQQKAIQEAASQTTFYSPYIMLVDLQDQSVLYEQQSDDKIYPASLTKIMTAVVALDHIANLSETLIVEEKDLAYLLEANASVAGLSVGDEVSYEELLYALLLPSGADAANVLANHLFGNQEAFITEMNEKAKAYGMLATHFKNATGLHEDDHYSTINDLKKMMDHAWNNTVLQKVLTTMEYDLPKLGLHLTSTLTSYGVTLAFPGGDIIGGKSGYTLEGECCLISIAEMEDGHQYMILSAKAPGDPVEDHHHIDDAKKLYEIAGSKLPVNN